MKSANFSLTIVLCLVIFSAPFETSAITVEIEEVAISAIVAGCGDGVVVGDEQCDGSALNGATCISRGFVGGTLSCAASCAFNTSACTSGGSSGGGGGGGGAAPLPSIPATNVVFTGRAYPKSTVTLLKDAQVAAVTVADADANFQVAISGVSGGNYIFSVYSEDSKGVRSSLLTFSISITSGVTTKIGNIFIAPTIAVDKSEVKRGNNIAIFGQSTPASEITISVNSEEEFFVKKMSDISGAYLLNFDTSVLEMGQHHTKSKSALNGEITSFSKVISFAVSTRDVLTQLPTLSAVRGNLNNDKRVNLVDFSIAAYWFKRPLSALFKQIEIEQLNGDGKVDLVDFSIMAFYWTG